jgi:hypothetical protein
VAAIKSIPFLSDEPFQYIKEDTAIDPKRGTIIFNINY